jgi:hypothetical protein
MYGRIILKQILKNGMRMGIGCTYLRVVCIVGLKDSGLWN